MPIGFGATRASDRIGNKPAFRAKTIATAVSSVYPFAARLRPIVSARSDHAAGLALRSPSWNLDRRKARLNLVRYAGRLFLRSDHVEIAKATNTRLSCTRCIRLQFELAMLERVGLIHSLPANVLEITALLMDEIISNAFGIAHDRFADRILFPGIDGPLLDNRARLLRPPRQRRAWQTRARVHGQGR
jgi:hypothetical protein